VESVVGNAQLMKKIRIAKIVFPTAAVLANVINFGLSLIPLALLILVLRFPLHWTWVYLPVPMLGLLLFTMGAAFLFSAVNVFLRDVSHIVQILLSAWFYCTPIIYSLDFIPAKHRWIFRLNPLLYVMNGFRLSIYYGLLPTVESVVMSLAVGLAALFVGYSVFRRYSDAFVFYV
jgi:ABC-type polysaccharide/polyol phosphate export permease